MTNPLGPVFTLEATQLARKPSTYWLRGAVVFMLLVTLAVVAFGERRRAMQRGTMGVREFADMGEKFYVGVLGTQLALVLLVAPAATAGSVCLDKARGNLTLVLATGLRSPEIVLGKLASRLMPVLGLVAVSIPVMFIATLLGGIDVRLLPAAYLVLAGSAAAGCAFALLLSVVGRKTHEVLLATYVAEIGFLMLWPLVSMAWWTAGWGRPSQWWMVTNPFLLIAAPVDGTWTDVAEWGSLAFAAGAVGFAVVCVAVAVAALRPAVLGDANRGAKRRWRFPWPRLHRVRRWLLEHRPLLWYEFHVRRPTAWGRVVAGIYFLVAGAATAVCVAQLVGSNSREMPALTVAFQVSVGMLMVSVTSVTSLAEERTRGNLDILLTTPLATRDIVRAKWLAAFRPVLLFGFLPTLLVVAVTARLAIETWFGGPRAAMGFGGRSAAGDVALALLCGNAVPLLILAYGAAITSLGLALAIRIRKFAVAVAVSVALYVFACVGVCMLLIATVGREDEAIWGMVASPFYGPGVNTAVVERPGMMMRMQHHLVIADAIWIGLYAAAALGFYVVAVRTFDRHMGRIAEGVTGPRRQLRPSI